MKTVWSILIIVVFALITFNGIAQINLKSLSNGNLDSESLDTISIYDSQFSNFNSTYYYNVSGNLSTEEPDTSWAGDFFKEYADLKSRFDQFRDGINLLYKIPDVVFSTLPFIDDEDLAFYRNIIWFLIAAIIILAVYQGLKTGRVTED